MTELKPQPSLTLSAYTFGELVYHTVVREVRTESGNAVLGLLQAIARILLLVAVFYILFVIAGVRGSLIRGDIVLFLVGGVLLFFMHNQAVSKTLKAGDVTGQMMQHAPMTTTVAILAAAISVVYLYVLAFFVILIVMFLARGHIEIHDPIGLMLPFMLAWASGVVIGLLFLLAKPFAPRQVALLSLLYMRANLITSGKFLVANLIPMKILPYFAWNPLFHSIDQMRGATFVNYFPHNTTITFPVYFVVFGLVIGMMGEFWLRNTVSKSTGNR